MPWYEHMHWASFVCKSTKVCLTQTWLSAAAFSDLSWAPLAAEWMEAGNGAKGTCTRICWKSWSYARDKEWSANDNHNTTMISNECYAKFQVSNFFFLMQCLEHLWLICKQVVASLADMWRRKTSLYEDIASNLPTKAAGACNLRNRKEIKEELMTSFKSGKHGQWWSSACLQGRRLFRWLLLVSKRVSSSKIIIFIDSFIDYDSSIKHSFLATCIRPRTMFGALEALNVPSPQNSKLHYQAWWQTDLSVSCFWFKDQSFWFFFNWEKNHDDDAVTSLQPRPPRRALRTLLATISELPHSQSSWLEPWESRVACLGLHGTLFNLLFEHHHHQHQHNL